jgi:PAS domain S-box-containing protein
MLRLFKLSTHLDGEAGVAIPADGYAEGFLLDAIGDGVLTTDANDRVTYANHAAAGLFGRERATLIGQPLLNLFARESAETIRFGQSAARDGLPQCYDVEVAGREDCSVSVGAAPLHAVDGSVGTVLTLRDVTDVRRAHQELAKSNRDTATSSRMRATPS